MIQYHKIQNAFKRNPENLKQVMNGVWTDPVFEYLAGAQWSFTEKVDGTNIRVIVEPAVSEGEQVRPWQAARILFKGKTDNANMHGDLVNRLNEMFLPQADALHEAFPEGACLYGEGYGAGIQKVGGNYGKTKEFVLFDVKIGDFWLERNNVIDISVKFGLLAVPEVMRGTLHEAIDMTAAGFNSAWGGFLAEGLIGKPLVELQTRYGSRIITKIKTCDFQS
jgi:hypothetical protein